MSDDNKTTDGDNVFDIRPADEENGILQLTIAENMPVDHFLLLEKMSAAQKHGVNPAQDLRASMKCKCQKTLTFEYLKIPPYNVQCPKCKTFYVKWHIIPAEQQPKETH